MKWYLLASLEGPTLHNLDSLIRMIKLSSSIYGFTTTMDYQTQLRDSMFVNIFFCWDFSKLTKLS